MEMNRMIAMFMEYCKSKQLRERTMLSYEQSLKLFAVWLEDVEEITHVEKIKEMTIRGRERLLLTVRREEGIIMIR